jgi:hypothetical protein
MIFSLREGAGTSIELWTSGSLHPSSGVSRSDVGHVRRPRPGHPLSGVALGVPRLPGADGQPAGADGHAGPVGPSSRPGRSASPISWPGGVVRGTGSGLLMARTCCAPRPPARDLRQRDRPKLGLTPASVEHRRVLAVPAFLRSARFPGARSARIRRRGTRPRRRGSGRSRGSSPSRCCGPGSSWQEGDAGSSSSAQRDLTTSGNREAEWFPRVSRTATSTTYRPVGSSSPRARKRR